MKLNIGCKRKPLDGFVNIDVIKTPATNKVIPWLNIDKVYSEESIEEIKVTRWSISRLTEQELDNVIPLWYKILKNNGKISITGHDLIKVCKKIGQTTASDHGIQNIPKPLYEKMFGFTVSNMNFLHARLYRVQDIIQRLEKAGFVDIYAINHERDEDAFEIIAQKYITKDEVKEPKPKKNIVDPDESKYNQFGIYGIQRSGTNFLQKFIGTNTELKYVKNEWKHTQKMPEGFKSYQNQERLCIYVYKSPYKWIESIIRNHEDVPKKWAPLYPLKTTGDGIVTVDSWHRGRDKPTQLNLEALTKCYSDHIKWWLWQKHSNLVFVQYEQLMVDPQAWLVELGERHQFTVKSNKVPEKVSQSDPFTDARKEYYINDSKLEYLTQEHINIINETIDPEILKFIKYKKL